ncbi:TadE/TadG family type IV pilus assembly protein [Falsihalocynthiibacter sp. S25ZX9]|uniref:TadE/TadG family type IV pilus assembly protein n=1 Tax=Falsihalocynthiibacter sp. S25ZX9 TaxID=3240870 RepID=UPI0035108AAC
MKHIFKSKETRQTHIPLLRRFMVGNEGSMTVEAIIMFPLLCWAYVATFAFFDAFQARSTNLKATFTVADMLSRQLDVVDAPYIEGLLDMFEFLSNSADDDTWIRVTSVVCTEECDKDARVLVKDWSFATGNNYTLTDVDVATYGDRVPVMPVHDRVLMIETFMNYQPVFNVGIPLLEMSELAVTRSRFAPKLCWETCVE